MMISDMKKYEIEKLEEKHIAGAAAVEKACFFEPWSEQSLRSELQKEGTAMFAAVYNGGVIGWAGLESVCGEGSVTNIAVLPAYRRRGVGEALTQALIDSARGLSLDWLMLEVRQSNHAAIALYEKLGFSYIGTRPDFYSYPRENATLMRHSLLQSVTLY